MSTISAYVRRFSDYANRKVEKIGNNKNFDKSLHFLNVRLANEAKSIVLEVKGNRDDKDLCNTAEFLAMTPFAASELICRMEDALHEMGFDFDKYRNRFFQRNKHSDQSESANG